jgi:hypothetical protein
MAQAAGLSLGNLRIVIGTMRSAVITRVDSPNVLT